MASIGVLVTGNPNTKMNNLTEVLDNHNMVFTNTGSEHTYEIYHQYWNTKEDTNRMRQFRKTADPPLKEFAYPQPWLANQYLLLNQESEYYPRIFTEEAQRDEYWLTAKKGVNHLHTTHKFFTSKELKFDHVHWRLIGTHNLIKTLGEMGIKHDVYVVIRYDALILSPRHVRELIDEVIENPNKVFGMSFHGQTFLFPTDRRKYYWRLRETGKRAQFWGNRLINGYHIPDICMVFHRSAWDVNKIQEVIDNKQLLPGEFGWWQCLYHLSRKKHKINIKRIDTNGVSLMRWIYREDFPTDWKVRHKERLEKKYKTYFDKFNMYMRGENP